MAAGSGTDRTVGLHVRRGDVQEGEAAVPVESNPSSPVSPDSAHNPGPARDAVSDPLHPRVATPTPTPKILLVKLQRGGFPLT